MVSIDVDVSRMGVDLSTQIGQDVANAISTSVQNSLAIVRDEWQRRAQNALHSTRLDYLLGLDFNSVVYPFDNDSFTGAVILRGTFPNMLESGFHAFDEKVGFSKSSRKYTTKSGGWYLTIPLRHSTPGAFMNGQQMSQSRYKEAKKLGNGERLRVSGGQKTSWTGYVHKNNIDDSLIRIVKAYKNPDTGKVTNQSQYLTFRRASNNSDPMSWMHPGFSGVKIAEQLEPYALQIFQKEVEKNLSSVLS